MGIGKGKRNETTAGDAEAAMADLDVDPEIVDYVPCYRSLAGTGNAMGFVAWRAD